MIEILSSSRSENKEISCISTCNCYFNFCFYLGENSLDFTKEKFGDSYYFSNCNHLTVSCFDTLKFLIPFHIRQPEDCYKLSNLIAYDKMNCLDFLLINQKIRLCNMCSISVTFVMVDQLKRINLI